MLLKVLAVASIVAVAILGATSIGRADTGTVPPWPIGDGGGVNGTGETILSRDVTLPLTKTHSADTLGVALKQLAIVPGFGAGINIQGIFLPGKLSPSSAQFFLGFYVPVHLGPCTQTDMKSQPQSAPDDAVVTLTDSGVAFCAALDQAASGFLDTGPGHVVLSEQQIAAFLFTAADDSTALAPCSATGSSWCLPAGVDVPTGAEVAYIGITAKPKGAIQPLTKKLPDLPFFISASNP